jgi:hypothetical protein
MNLAEALAQTGADFDFDPPRMGTLAKFRPDLQSDGFDPDIRDRGDDQ